MDSVFGRHIKERRKTWAYHFYCHQGQYRSHPDRGGVNTELLKRIADIEAELQTLKNQVATEEKYGLAKITGVTTVTDEDAGLVLGAKEKNTSIDGTLANNIESVKEKFSIKHHQVQLIVDENNVSRLMCYSIGNVAFVVCSINIGIKVNNANGIMVVPERIRPPETTQWIFAGYAYGESGVSPEGQFLISARANRDGAIVVANDFGASMNGLNISFHYPF